MSKRVKATKKEMSVESGTSIETKGSQGAVAFVSNCIRNKTSDRHVLSFVGKRVWVDMSSLQNIVIGGEKVHQVMISSEDGKKQTAILTKYLFTDSKGLLECGAQQSPFL